MEYKEIILIILEQLAGQEKASTKKKDQDVPWSSPMALPETSTWKSGKHMRVKYLLIFAATPKKLRSTKMAGAIFL